MKISAINRLADILEPPSSGGDEIDWDAIFENFGMRFPVDYREFVALYGGGEINEFLRIATPPVGDSIYGYLLDGSDLALRPEDRVHLAGHFPIREKLSIMTLGQTASSDVVCWLRSDLNPDRWKIAVFRRQSHYGESPWLVFDCGLVDFLLAALEGAIDPFSDESFSRAPHQFFGWREMTAP